jgi:HEAT repeat protein
MMASSGTRKSKGLESALVALLSHDDAERRSAAALVVGELGLDDDATFAQLKARLHDDNAVVRLRAAEALGRLESETLALDLQPLLTDGEARVRNVVRRVLAEARHLGPSDLEAMLDAKDEKERLGAVAVLGARADLDSMQILARTLFNAHGRLLDAIKAALLEDLSNLSDDERSAVVETLRAQLTPERLDERPPVGVAAAEVLAADGEGASRLLVTWCAKVTAEPVRVAAAQAVRQQTGSRRFTARLYEAVLELIEDEGTPEAVMAPLSEALTQCDLPMALEPRVRRLTGAPLRAVRSFALRALGGLDSAPAAKALAEVAKRDDITDRKSAIAAAVQTASGRTALARLLAGTSDVALAEAVSQALRSTEALLPSTIHELEQAALEADDEVSPVILALLKQVGGESAGRVQGSLHEKAIKLKNRGELDDAIHMLERMLQGADDPEARFQLGVCQLRLSKKHLTRGSKQEPTAQTFRLLARRRDFPTLERLLAEPEIGPEELFYLGFVLVEGEGDGQNLGGDLLTHLAESDEDATMKRRAHNKLVTMGWIEA